MEIDQRLIPYSVYLPKDLIDEMRKVAKSRGHPNTFAMQSLTRLPVATHMQKVLMQGSRRSRCCACNSRCQQPFGWQRKTSACRCNRGLYRSITR